MSGTNPVATWVLTNYGTMTGTTYPLQIDANFDVAQRIVDRFAPHPAGTPNMTVILDAGAILNGTTLTEIASQTTSTFTAPVTHDRIDRIVVDQTTGVYSIVAGTENVSPSPPAIPTGKYPVAQVLLHISTTAITTSLITDERLLVNSGNSGGSVTSVALSSTDLSVSGSPITTSGTITANVQVSANTAALYAYAQSEFGGL